MFSAHDFFLIGWPSVALGLCLVVRHRGLAKRRERLPISEKLLRPPGESLRKQIEVLDEKLSEAIGMAFLPATALGIFRVIGGEKFGGKGVVGDAVCLVFGFITFVFGAIWTFRIARDLRDYRLGFHGERAAGEELNQLMRDGCQVFHDVPMSPYGNIDHVVVAPTGVYAVETKTRRKRKCPPGKRDHEVVYDGKTLSFPHYFETNSLEQARQQANRLRVKLGEAVGDPVPVTPILTLPGWLVTSRVRTGTRVLNPKNVREVVLDSRNGKLPPQLAARVVYQLEQWCRDVEI